MVIAISQILFLFILGFVVSANATTTSLRIAIVHSYDKNFYWTKLVEKGFLERIAKSYSVEVVYEASLNAKADPAGILRLKDQINQDLKKAKFDVLFITDDDALTHVATNYYNTKTQVAFAGINSPLSEYGNSEEEINKLAPANISGVLEKYNVRPLIRLITDLLPKTKNITIMYDRSVTADASFAELEKEIGTQREFGSAQLKIVRTNDFQVWKKTITKAKSDDALIIFPYSNVKRPQSLDIDTPAKFATWVSAHSKAPEFASASFASKTDFFANTGLNPYEHGEDSALAFLNSQNPSTALKRITTKNYARLRLNYERAQKLNVQIPFELFAYSYALSKSTTP